MENNIYNTFDRKLYKQGNPLYSGDGTPLSDISNISPGSIGDGFSHGATEVVQNNLQSGKFQTGVSGWSIDADGNAEFNNGTFRGTFIIGGSLITVTDISNLQSAIDSLALIGGGTVALAPDTYTATTSFTVPSNVTVDGSGSTIDFGGGAYQFLIQGTNAYSTGTITATFGSKNIVGVGTTWTAAMVGQSILLGDYWYTIASRTDNTHIALTTNFIGTNLSGDTYVIATTVDGPNLLNLTLYNSSTKLVEIRYVNGMKMDSIVCDTGTYGVYVRDSGSVSWLNSTIGNCTSGGFYGNNIPFSNLNVYFVYNITGTGIELIRDTNAAFNTGSVQAITGVGVKMTNCVNMDYAVFSVIECTSHGVELVSGCGGIDVIDGYINTVGGDGVKFTASNTGIQCITTSIYNTTSYGVNNAAASNNNITIGINYYSSCTAGNVNDSGTNTSIIADDTVYGSGWNGSLGTPTKNAVYDKIELVSAAGANTALSNLASVSINTALLFQTTVDIGSTTKPARDIYLYGSGTYSTTYLKLTGTPTSTRTVTFPDASITVARTDAAQTFTGVQTMTSPVIVTSIDTSSVSFTAFAGATTLMTIGGTGASASAFFPSTLDTSSSITGAIRTSGGISAAKAANIGTTLTVGTGYQIGGAAASGKILIGNGTNFVASTPTYPNAAGTSGNVLTSDGTNFVSSASSSATCVTVLPPPVCVVDPGNTSAVNTVNMNSNTTMLVGQIVIPFQITVNKVSFRVGVSNVNGTADVTLFTEDGQTQKFSVTTATISAAATITTAVSAVVVPAGVYYIAINTNLTADFSPLFWDTENDTSFQFLVNGIASEPVLEGTVTISAGTPAAFTPSSVTYVENRTLFFRLDN